MLFNLMLPDRSSSKSEYDENFVQLSMEQNLAQFSHWDFSFDILRAFNKFLNNVLILIIETVRV